MKGTIRYVLRDEGDSSVKSHQVRSLHGGVPQSRRCYKFLPIEPNDVEYDKISRSEDVYMSPNSSFVRKVVDKDMSIAEKDLLIQELTAKVKRVKRMGLFRFDDLELSDTYYENDD